MSSKRKSKRTTKKKLSRHGRQNLQEKLNYWSDNLRGEIETKKPHIARPARAVPPQTPKNSMMGNRRKGMTFGTNRPAPTPKTRGKWLHFLKNEDEEKVKVDGKVIKLEDAIDVARRKDAEHQWNCQNNPEYALNDSELKEYNKKIQEANKIIQDAEQKINVLQTKVGKLDKTLTRLQKSKERHFKDMGDLEIIKKTAIQSKYEMIKPSEQKCDEQWPNLKLLLQQTPKELKGYVASVLGMNSYEESSEEKYPDQRLPAIAEGKKRKKKKKTRRKRNKRNKRNRHKTTRKIKK